MRTDEHAGRSLELTLMGAAAHAQLGNWQQFIDRICDALWVAHEGHHEQMADRRMVELLRAIAGNEWAPDKEGH